MALSIIENAIKLAAEQETSAASQIDTHEGDPEAEEINALVAERVTAKKEKNFARADEIRNILTQKGITVTDTPNGPVWKRN